MPAPTLFFFTKGNRSTASSRYRAYGIGDALQAHARCEVRYIPLQRPLPYFKLFFCIKKRDTVVLQRPTFAPRTFFIFLLLVRIIRHPSIVFDLDDYQPQHSKRRVDWLIRLSHCLIAGSAFIAAYMRTARREAVTIPTVVPYEIYQRHAKTNYRHSLPLTIGWIGDAPAHRENLQFLGAVLHALQDKTLSFKFFLIGSADEKSILSIFSFLGGRFNHIPSLPWENIQNTAARIAQFDIAVMPLMDTPWNRGKCAFKAIECMACGIPVVVSPVGENNTLVRDGKNGLIAATADEWVRALARLLNDDELREKLGREGARAIERSYSVTSVLPQYMKLFNLQQRASFLSQQPP